MSESMLKWALIYARQGMYVFPLAPGTKVPLAGSNGLLDATTDEETIKRWWREHPQANIGLNCERSNLFVVDVDTKPGKVGAQSLLELIGDDFSPLETRKAKTWSGGSHYFYAGTGRSTQSELGQHIDTKGVGGYAVLAPSRVSEDGKMGAYSWVNNNPETGKTLPCLPIPELFRPREDAIVSIIKPRDIVRIENGSRNAELARIAGAYRRIGMPPSSIAAALHEDNKLRCVEPLPEREVDAIAKGMARYEPHHRLEEPSAAGSFRFRRVVDMIERANEHVEWVIEGLLREGDLCLLSARPGAGKSTLMRTLAGCVTNGQAFLSRRTKKGPVAWIGMEETDRTYISAVEDMGLLDADIWYAGQSDVPPENRLQWLEGFLAEMKPSLVIIDTLAAFCAINDINHYSEVGKALDPLLAMRGRHGAGIVLVHHNNKADTPLGSTKILALVDAALTMTVSPEGQRTMKSLKLRDGVPLEETILKYDEATRWMHADEPKWVADQRACENKILGYLEPGMWETRQELAQRAGRKGAVARNAVDSLLAKGLLVSRGTGKKNDPKQYGPTDFPVRTKSEPSPKHPVVSEQPKESEQSEESEGLWQHVASVLGPLQEIFDDTPREGELPL